MPPGLGFSAILILVASRCVPDYYALLAAPEWAASTVDLLCCNSRNAMHPGSRFRAAELFVAGAEPLVLRRRRNVASAAAGRRPISAKEWSVRERGIVKWFNGAKGY